METPDTHVNQVAIIRGAISLLLERSHSAQYYLNELLKLMDADPSLLLDTQGVESLYRLALEGSSAMNLAGDRAHDIRTAITKDGAKLSLLRGQAREVISDRTKVELKNGKGVTFIVEYDETDNCLSVESNSALQINVDGPRQISLY